MNVGMKVKFRKNILDLLPERSLGRTVFCFFLGEKDDFYATLGGIFRERAEC